MQTLDLVQRVEVLEEKLESLKLLREDLACVLRQHENQLRSIAMDLNVLERKLKAL
jgi:hypothetical protein